MPAFSQHEKTTIPINEECGPDIFFRNRRLGDHRAVCDVPLGPRIEPSARVGMRKILWLSSSNPDIARGDTGEASMPVSAHPRPGMYAPLNSRLSSKPMVPSSQPTGRRAVVVRWLVLLIGSVLLAGALEAYRLPAALLLGPMATAAVLGISGRAVRVASPIFLVAQAIVGTMIAQSMPPGVFGEIAKIWPIILCGVVFVVVLSNGLGWLIARRRVLPGTTAVWGSSPGAATAMVIMAEAYGGDMRLVAMMQYLRVIIVASTASLVARLTIGGALADAPAIVWFPPVDWVGFGATLGVIAAGLLISKVFHLATGAMIVPMVLAILLQAMGLITIVLPPWLLAVSYAIVGWSIGLRFTPAILGYAARALPAIILSIIVLVGVCALFGMGLAVVTGIDPLTAYLATSPGGADSVAIIAASVPVDVPFVMAMQTMRFILVLLTGPAVARILAGYLTGPGSV